MLSIRPLSLSSAEAMIDNFLSSTGETERPDEVLGLYIGEEVAGYYALDRTEDGELVIRHGYLLPQYQRKGYAKQFIDLLCSMAKVAGYTSVLCASGRNPKSYTRFIGRFGFKPDYTVYKRTL